MNECNWINFQKRLINNAKLFISDPSKYTKFQSFNPIFKCIFIIFSSYTVQTLKNSRTEIFARLIFSSSEVF